LLERADPSLGEQLAGHVLRSGLVTEGAAVAGVWPLGQEIDIRPLLLALHERGHAILLPETTPRGNALIFRHWSPESVMIKERFGTFRPDGETGVPDLLLVPLLAFDRAGNRLGYGGGYYDRTLAALPGRPAIGFGYACQEVDTLPAEPHDRPLDAIATELGVHIVERRT
jgi:5-formyltetrahydrofolate cyclo-ligase